MITKETVRILQEDDKELKHVSNNITKSTRQELKTLSETELKLHYNEYMRRYRYKKRSNWNAIRRQNYKKYHTKQDNNSNNITKPIQIKEVLSIK